MKFLDMNSLKDRLLMHLCNMGIDKSHWNYYLANLNPQAINEDITDEQIKAAIVAKELFWGLGDAIADYLQWEENQI